MAQTQQNKKKKWVVLPLAGMTAAFTQSSCKTHSALAEFHRLSDISLFLASMQNPRGSFINQSIITNHLSYLLTLYVSNVGPLSFQDSHSSSLRARVQSGSKLHMWKAGKKENRNMLIVNWLSFSVWMAIVALHPVIVFRLPYGPKRKVKNQSKYMKELFL